MTVAELGQRMSSAELTDWIAVYTLEAEEDAARRTQLPDGSATSGVPDNRIVIPDPAEVTRRMKAWRAGRRRAKATS